MKYVSAKITFDHDNPSIKFYRWNIAYITDACIMHSIFNYKRARHYNAKVEASREFPNNKIPAIHIFLHKLWYRVFPICKTLFTTAVDPSNRFSRCARQCGRGIYSFLIREQCFSSLKYFASGNIFRWIFSQPCEVLFNIVYTLAFFGATNRYRRNVCWCVN